MWRDREGKSVLRKVDSGPQFTVSSRSEASGQNPQIHRERWGSKAHVPKRILGDFPADGEGCLLTCSIDLVQCLQLHSGAQRGLWSGQVSEVKSDPREATFWRELPGAEFTMKKGQAGLGGRARGGDREGERGSLECCGEREGSLGRSGI